jgi:predicted naringenin-chalcone synthase
MPRNAVYLTPPQFVKPLHSAPQDELLQFLAEIHGTSDPQAARLVQRFGVKESQIASRSFECSDVFLPAAEREIYRLGPGLEHGVSIYARGQFYARRVGEIFSEFYPASALAPDHLVHVTCTGYLAPSGAQNLVSQRGWATEITHAYHMGCYAALPAIRLAWGQSLAFGQAVDVVHTEICSLHMNPSDHRPEQLVVQSLFADGHARYTVSQKKTGPAFRLLALHEQMLAGSAGDMEWMPAPWGMKMTLSREVPVKIKGAVREFLVALLKKSGLTLSEALRDAVFAVHPGGPKIIDSVQECLELGHCQVAASRLVLLERGNMSSATLPHVWDQIAMRKDTVPVVSLAFGPGLTMFGGVFQWEP